MGNWELRRDICEGEGGGVSQGWWEINNTENGGVGVRGEGEGRVRVRGEVRGDRGCRFRF